MTRHQTRMSFNVERQLGLISFFLEILLGRNKQERMSGIICSCESLLLLFRTLEPSASPNFSIMVTRKHPARHHPRAVGLAGLLLSVKAGLLDHQPAAVWGQVAPGP